MKHLGLLAVLAIAGMSAAAWSEPLIPQNVQPYSADLLKLVRPGTGRQMGNDFVGQQDQSHGIVLLER